MMWMMELSNDDDDDDAMMEDYSTNILKIESLSRKTYESNLR